MKQRGRGRPMKEPTDLITLDMAVSRIREHLSEKYSPTVAEACALAKGTLYNKLSKGEIHRWKKGKVVLVSESEILKLVS